MTDISILVSTSPRPGHPDCEILDQTISSLRATLPDAPIVIMADGCPLDTPPQRMMNYSGFKQKIAGRYDKCTILEFDGQHQQAGMLTRGLELVDTQLLVYAEDDWSFSPNIQWPELSKIVLSGRANYIKFHAYCRIHPLHWGMMIDHVIWDNIPLFRTIQWSQNPHIASTDYYRRIHDEYLVGKRDCIENIMHSECACQINDWEKHKLCIYDPMDEGAMTMVRHLDGRKGER